MISLHPTLTHSNSVSEDRFTLPHLSVSQQPASSALRAHYTTTKMPVSFSSPSGTQCPRLDAYKALKYSQLEVFAENRYQTPKERELYKSSLLAISADNDLEPTEAKLGELLYFREGSLLAAKQRVNEMTRLQLEHESLVRGLLTRNELPPLSDFRLRALLLGDQLQLEAENRAARLASPDSGYVSAVGSDEELSGPDANDDKPGHIVRHWHPELGQSVSYRY